MSRIVRILSLQGSRTLRPPRTVPSFQDRRQPCFSCAPTANAATKIFSRGLRRPESAALSARSALSAARSSCSMCARTVAESSFAGLAALRTSFKDFPARRSESTSPRAAPLPRSQGGSSSSRRTAFQDQAASTPNPSFEARPNGVALGPRSAFVHDAPRGPSTTPSVPPQLER
jgi:hypothetical protein